MATPHETIRAFLAIELDSPVREALVAEIERLRSRPVAVAWVRQENLHLTLRFFGNVSQEFIASYVERITPYVSAMTPIRAHVRGMGVFPSPRRASIIWAGLEVDGPGLEALSAEVERVAGELGLTPEMRRFVPHVTLGRIRRPPPRALMLRFLEEAREFDAGAFTIDAVSLFSSELTQTGARHTRLHRLTFDGIRGTGGI